MALRQALIFISRFTITTSPRRRVSLSIPSPIQSTSLMATKASVHFPPQHQIPRLVLLRNQAAARHRCFQTPGRTVFQSSNVHRNYLAGPAPFMVIHFSIILPRNGSWTIPTRNLSLLLMNEYHIRDLANISYCGGPKKYDYPTYSELTQGTYLPTDDWSLVTTMLMADPNQQKGRRSLKWT
jgi:hypothetical protein